MCYQLLNRIWITSSNPSDISYQIEMRIDNRYRSITANIHSNGERGVEKEREKINGVATE